MKGINNTIDISQFVITDIRFKFFNGKINYTVEYCSGLNKWFIFKDVGTSGCLASYKAEVGDEASEVYAIHYLEKYITRRNAYKQRR